MQFKNDCGVPAGIAVRRWMLLALLTACGRLVAADLDSLPPGRWYRFADSKLEAVAPKAEVDGSVRAVMHAWSGGVYDTDRERLVVWGGGHKDYAGNEVYAFGPLTAARPQWERLTEPSAPPAVNAAHGADQRPVSRHSYNLLSYLPAPHHKMMSCGIGSRYADGYSDAAVDFYDFTIDGRSGEPWSQGPEAPSTVYATNGFCAYNPKTQQAWYQDMGSSSSQLQRYDVVRKRWTGHVRFNPDSEPTAAIDTRRNLLVSTGNRNGTLLYDLERPNSAPLKLQTQGPQVVETAKFPGFDYDPVNDQFVGWGGGAQLYALKIPANPRRDRWEWSAIELDPGNDVTPTQAAGLRVTGYVTGTFGRFRYVPSLQGVVLVNATDEDVFFFKLPTGSGRAAPAAHAAPDTAAPASAAAPERQLLAQLNAQIVEPKAEDRLPTVTLQSLARAGQNDVVFTFGQVFKIGAVPKGSSVTARLDDGSGMSLQVDAKATHGDGSLRHAVLSGKLNTLPGKGTRGLMLSTGAASGGAALPMSAVLNSAYDTTVALNLDGTIYSASARQALSGTNVKTWLSGPLVSEWIAGMPVKNASGQAHPHLTAYFHVRAYAGLAQIRTDVVIENNWVFVPSPNDFSYKVAVKIPGKSDYVKTLTHYSRTRWHKRFWWGSEPQVYAKLDKTYLQDTQAIPKYENVQPTETYLSSVRRSTEPMSNGDQQANMEDTGYQSGIGPLPQWDAVYAVSTDVRAFDFMLANADGGTAYSTHFRDEKTGLPISIDNYPTTSLSDPESSRPDVPVAGGSPYNVVWAAHQPSIGYLPYVVTGDYFYLEEMQFWSAYNLFWCNAEYRKFDQGWWYTGSLRGQAWAYRSLAQAAYITPDAHPLKGYLLAKLSNNIKRDTELYVSPGGPHKNNLGAMKSYEGNQEYRFFDYFMSWAVQYVADLGFKEIVPFRNYKLKFPIGIMGSGADQYCFQAAARYTWNIGPAGDTTFYPDFKTVFANTVPGANPALCGTRAMADYLSTKFEAKVSGPNGMLGDQTSTTYWFAQLQPALAAAYDAQLPGAREAWERALASKVHPDYRDNPIWAVVPRTVPLRAR